MYFIFSKYINDFVFDYSYHDFEVNKLSFFSNKLHARKNLDPCRVRSNLHLNLLRAYVSIQKQKNDRKYSKFLIKFLINHLRVYVYLCDVTIIQNAGKMT